MFFKKPKSVASLDSKYLKLCEQAANDSKIFDNFRNLKEYKNILEHVDHDLAKKYYENIKNISSLTNSEIFNICEKLSNIGKPELVKIVDKLIIQVDERLIPLFKRSFDKRIIYINNNQSLENVKYDFHIAMGSLLKFLRKSKEDIKKGKRINGTI